MVSLKIEKENDALDYVIRRILQIRSANAREDKLASLIRLCEECSEAKRRGNPEIFLKIVKTIVQRRGFRIVVCRSNSRREIIKSIIQVRYLYDTFYYLIFIIFSFLRTSFLWFQQLSPYSVDLL